MNTSFNLIFFHFVIRRKLSIIRCNRLLIVEQAISPESLKSMPKITKVSYSLLQSLTDGRTDSIIEKHQIKKKYLMVYSTQIYHQ